MKRIKKLVKTAMAVFLPLALSTSAIAADAWKDGTYTGSGNGFNGKITVNVTISDGKITDIAEVSQGEDFWYAFSTIRSKIIKTQQSHVDAVSGATYTSDGIMSAVSSALEQAKLPAETPAPTKTPEPTMEPTSIPEPTSTPEAPSESEQKTADEITISISKAHMELLEGESVSLTATSTSKTGEAFSENYIWESSDTKVATVKNGQVKALEEGSATITVTGEKSKKRASCTVVVEAAATTGMVFLTGSNADIYCITSVKSQTVTYMTSGKETAAVNIPSTVNFQKKTYRVTKIAADAFSGNTKLKSITFGDELQSIPASAFIGCQNLIFVRLGKKISSIGKNAFSGDKKLSRLILGDALKTIGDGAFQNCNRLVNLTLGKNINRIGTKAFYGCKKLKKITVQTTSLKHMGEKAFQNIAAKAVITIPKKRIKTYRKLWKKAGAGKKVTYQAS